jgi:hypothetical protein
MSRFSKSSASESSLVSPEQKCAGWPGLAMLALLSPIVGWAQTAVVSDVSVPPAGVYDRSLALGFVVHFSAPVMVQGAPRLAITVGQQTRYATAVIPLTASAGSTAVTFEYVPAPSDADPDGIVLAGTIDLNGGAITTADSKATGLTLAPTNTQAIRISVALPPTPRIIAATRAGADGNSLVLEGIADAGSMVMVTRTDAGVVGATIARDNGSWSFTCPAVAQGSFQFTAAIENDAGIVSLDSAPFRVVVKSSGTVNIESSRPAGYAAL